MLKISDAGYAGWAEALCGKNEPQLDIAQWGQCFTQLQELSESQVIAHLVQMRDVWPVKELECAGMAVLDSAGRVKQTPTIALLGLQGREAVPGLFYVLEDDPQQAAEQARLSLEQNLRTLAPKSMRNCCAARARLTVLFEVRRSSRLPTHF